MNNNIKWIGVIDCFYTVLRVFTDTFLIAYLFRISEQNILNIAMYYFSVHAFVAIAAFFSFPYLKQGFMVRVYRLGIVTNFLLFFFVYITGDNAKNYIEFLGMFFGLTISLRGLSRIVLTSENVSETQMIKFRGYIEVIKGILRVGVPFILGLFLSFDSFYQIVQVLSVLLLLEYASTYRIKEKPKNKQIRMETLNFLRTIRHNKTVLKSYYMDICRGLTVEGIYPVVITLYVVYLFKTDFKLGAITSFFYVVTLIVNYLFGKYCRYGYFAKVTITASIIAVMCSCLFIVYPNHLSFIIYNFSAVTAVQSLWLVTEVNMFNIANLENVQKYKNEYFLVREMIMTVGKMIGISALIVIGIYKNFDTLKYLLLILTVAIFLMGYYATAINKSMFGKHK